jgi:hypothetical protein
LRIFALIVSINDEVQLILLAGHLLLLFLLVPLSFGLIDLLQQLLFVQLFDHLSILLAIFIGDYGPGCIVSAFFFLMLPPLLGYSDLPLQILSELIPSPLL